jgi:ABC-type bacteriocin/lantibiotic exporter with double-glycine peptidase domain
MSEQPPPPRAALPPGPDLTPLLMVLVEVAGVPVEEDRLREAADQGVGRGDWVRRLERAAPAAGLRLRWLSATAAEAAGLCRPDLPVVGLSADVGAGPRWVLLEGQRRGRVKVRTLPDLLPPREVPAAALAAHLLGVDAEARLPWALVEPALPAAGLLGDGGPGAPPPTPMRRVLALMRVERADIAAVVLFALAVGVLNLGTPITMQVLINWLAFGAVGQPVIALSLALLVFLSLAAGLRSLQRHAVEIVQRRIFVRMVAELTTRLSHVRVRAFDGQSGPELVNRFFDIITVQKAVASLLLDGVAALLQAVVGLGLLAVYHPFLLAFDVVLIAVLIVVLVLLGRGAESTAVLESKAKYAVASWAEELARHPALFKLGFGEHLATERADVLARKYLTYRDKHWKVYFRQFWAALAVQAIATVALLGLGGTLVLDGELTVGQLVAAEFIVTAALAGFTKVAHKLDTFYDLLAGIDKLGQLIALPQERTTGAEPPGAGPSALRLRGVRAFAGAAPVDVAWPAGSRVALVGGGGSGKSTLADVILGLREAAGGVIERDGVDLALLRPAPLHHEALLCRGPAVVMGTVLENLTLSCPGVGPVEGWAALEAVGLAERVRALPQGLDTPLVHSGAPLSTTMALRLGLARPLVSRPRLVVVDCVFDGLPPADRSPLIGLLADPAAPWTLIVLTADPAVAAHPAFTHRHALHAGGLDVR